jgi:hypothetical protein
MQSCIHLIRLSDQDIRFPLALFYSQNVNDDGIMQVSKAQNIK